MDILLVEDNPADAELFRLCLEQREVDVTLHHVEDGEAAIQWLDQAPPYTSAPRPALVMLDLNLPRRSGLDVLRHIREAPATRTIPVIMITTSAAPHDINRSYEYGANCYIKKPMGFTEFQRIVELVDEFWLQTVVLPTGVTSE